MRSRGEGGREEGVKWVDLRDEEIGRGSQKKRVVGFTHSHFHSLSVCVCISQHAPPA